MAILMTIGGGSWAVVIAACLELKRKGILFEAPIKSVVFFMKEKVK
jgi:hypothetical protein